MRTFIQRFTLCALLLLLGCSAFAQGTAFTYQGRLNDGNAPANGLYDLRFSVWDASTNGNLVAWPITNSPTVVSNGLFAVTLDFGPGVFTGPDRWLELDVRTNGGADFAPLLPLQPVLPVPYATMANSASNLLGALPAGQLSGTVPLAQLPSAVVTNDGGAVVLVGAFSGNGAGLTNLNAANLSGSPLLDDLYFKTPSAHTGTIYSGTNTVMIMDNNLDIFLGIGAGNSWLSGAIPYFDGENTGVGYQVLHSGEGWFNTALGAFALASNQVSYDNTALGDVALRNNTYGVRNTAAGSAALMDNTNGGENTAVGFMALGYNLSGSDNTAVGHLALYANSIGSNNIALGQGSGKNITGSYNIDIGNPGISTDENIIRIGDSQTQTFLAGVITGNGAGLTNLSTSSLIGNTLTLGNSYIAPLTVDPTVPSHATGGAGRGTGPVSLAVAGNYAYVVKYDGSWLVVYDVSFPSAPVSNNMVSTFGGSVSIAAAGRYVYVVNYDVSKLQIFDVSDPAAPVSVGSANTGYRPTCVAVSGRYAYVVNLGANSLQVFDVGDPTKPVLVATRSTDSQPWSVAVSGRYAYVANSGSSTLQIFDVGNPASMPAGPVGSLGTDGLPYSVAVSGRYAYVVNYTAGTLQVIDVLNPASPVIVGSVPTGQLPHSVTVAGRYAYVVNAQSDTLQLFDVSTPSHPFLVGTVGTGSEAACVAVAGRYAYVVNHGGDVALQSFDLGGAYIQQLESGALETGNLQVRDTATLGNNLDVRGGLTVSASARITGGLSVDNGTITGNGAGLTNISTAALQGTFTGNGAGLTNLNAANVSGIFTGDGSGLTGVNASLLGGLPAGSFAQVNSSPSFTGLTVNGEATVTAINITSDRNAKEDFASVQPRDVLEKLMHVPISTWQYKSQPGERHIGPMAQDFRAAFSTGRDEKHITTVDADGVALAAIQGLNQKVDELNAALQQRDAENTELKADIAGLKQLVGQLEQRVPATPAK